MLKAQRFKPQSNIIALLSWYSNFHSNFFCNLDAYPRPKLRIRLREGRTAASDADPEAPTWLPLNNTVCMSVFFFKFVFGVVWMIFVQCTISAWLWICRSSCVCTHKHKLSINHHQTSIDNNQWFFKTKRFDDCSTSVHHRLLLFWCSNPESRKSKYTSLISRQFILADIQNLKSRVSIPVSTHKAGTRPVVPGSPRRLKLAIINIMCWGNEKKYSKTILQWSSWQAKKKSIYYQHLRMSIRNHAGNLAVQCDGKMCPLLAA